MANGIEDALKSPYVNVVLRITPPQTEPLDLPFIQRVFEESIKRDGFITRYYVWSELSDVRRGEVLVYDPGRHAFVDDAPEAAALMEQIQAFAAAKRAIVAFDTAFDGKPTYVQAQLRFTQPTRDRLAAFVGFAVDAGRLRRDYFPSLLASKLGAINDPTGFPPLLVSVVDDHGRVVFPPGGAPRLRVVDEREFPLMFVDKELATLAAPVERGRETWRVRTGYDGRTIADIVESRARPQRLMMAMLAGILALGVFVVVRVLAREVRLAELKSNFVSSVSHDLKTPLALIQLFAETLELGRLKHTDRAHEYYRIINSEARKLSRLINNLLDFSKIEAGLRQYKPAPADLAALTRRVLDSLESQFRHNEFSVQSRCAPDLPPVLIDAEAAEQAIENLLSNAMKYSPEHREIVVEVDAFDGFGRVRVTDRGVGIPPRFQRKIFRKFYRIQTDAGSGPQGTGLGLAIVDHIMRGNGGFVQVESEPGRGSTFSLHFPLCSGEAHGDETDSGDRGRAANVARPA